MSDSGESAIQTPIYRYPNVRFSRISQVKAKDMGLFVRLTRIGQKNPSDNSPHSTSCTPHSCTTQRLRITPFAASNPSALPSAVTILQQLDDCAGNATQDAANRPRNPENSSPKLGSPPSAAFALTPTNSMSSAITVAISMMIPHTAPVSLL